MLIVTVAHQGNPDEDTEDVLMFSVVVDVRGELSLCSKILAAVEERVRAEAPKREPGWNEDRLRKAMLEADRAIEAGSNAEARTVLADAIRDTDDIPF